MLQVSVVPYVVSVALSPDEAMDMPDSRDVLRSRLECEADDRDYLSIAIWRRGSSALLLVNGWYSPGPRSGFLPGILVVPETAVAFIGAGTVARSYSLESPALIECHETSVGFSGWQQHGNLVVMACELELSVWTTQGTRLWSRFVEPPWSYEVEGEQIDVDVMGEQVRLDMRTGMPA
ncbi:MULTISPECIES: hypothetical protein [Ramlibacter]|uniref:Uncharacterized protein n=1 Tax=Ramlibacter pinisoli TaxID=2682844 RepID=A0A6N8IR65_9BURK|nr:MULTISPECIES: hypothetical protein [Ramlibacter]MBA2964348.1 hypothetical protein [Ramlibacter sp. CGMCC 1.13660]MVQ29314.1 hypothetical protein [Ramlibacter pinisoli]